MNYCRSSPHGAQEPLYMVMQFSSTRLPEVSRPSIWLISICMAFSPFS